MEQAGSVSWTGQPRDDTGHNVSLPLQNKIQKKEMEQSSGELTVCDSRDELYEQDLQL